MRILVAFSSFAIGSVVIPAWGDPITKREAADWVDHVRRIKDWGPEVDLAQEAETRLLRANIGLKRSPDSREYMRDRGDAFHTLGHMAEHKHRFEEAILFHQEANESYRRSGYETHESWADGRTHAKEHIFMNLYDLGVFFEEKNQNDIAVRYFRAALTFAHQNSLYHELGMGGDRFAPRYEGLESKLDSKDFFALKLGIEMVKGMRAVLGEVRCAAVFVPIRSN